MHNWYVEESGLDVEGTMPGDTVSEETGTLVGEETKIAVDEAPTVVVTTAGAGLGLPRGSDVGATNSNDNAVDGCTVRDGSGGGVKGTMTGVPVSK